MLSKPKQQTNIFSRNMASTNTPRINNGPSRLLADLPSFAHVNVNEHNIDPSLRDNATNTRTTRTAPATLLGFTPVRAQDSPIVPTATKNDNAENREVDGLRDEDEDEMDIDDEYGHDDDDDDADGQGGFRPSKKLGPPQSRIRSVNDFMQMFNTPYLDLNPCTCKSLLLISFYLIDRYG